MKILGLGDNIIDRFIDKGIDYPGGNAVNVAVYAARAGVEASYVGVFGDDELGEFLREAIASERVSIDRSVVRRGESGITSLHVVDGDRTFLDWNGGGVTVHEPIDLNDGRLAYAAEFDVVHTSVYSGIEPELQRLASIDTRVSYDFSSDPEYRTPDYISQVAPHIDLALISCSEQSVDETRELLETLVSNGAGLALATRGIEGAIVTDGVNWCSAPALVIEDPSTIVDTMGCGDAFVAAFIMHLQGAGWASGVKVASDDLQAALHAAARASREQCFEEAAFGEADPLRAGRQNLRRSRFPARATSKRHARGH